jgi:hypothetical protein
VRKNARLLEASISNVAIPPPSPGPPLASNSRFPSLPPTKKVESLQEGFEISWQWRGEEIGDYNEDFVDIQETNLFASTSTFEEHEEDDFLEEDYASNDSRSLEDYWWLEECLYNVDFLFIKRHLEYVQFYCIMINLSNFRI